MGVLKSNFMPREFEYQKNHKTRKTQKTGIFKKNYDFFVFPMFRSI